MRYIDQIITEQVKTWAQREAEAKRIGQAPGAWPIITISREFGADGRALATTLGARTGFKVWDRELLSAIAEEGGSDERLLASLDEHRRKAIDDAMHGTLLGSQSTNTHYFRALVRVVHTIDAHGRGIIVGRGANYISKSARTLRVRVVRPLDERVHAYAGRYGLSERAARKQVIAEDADRDDFIRHYFRREHGQAADYDLVLNASGFSLDQMADLVLMAYEMKVGKKAPVAG